jgi:clan AA aspartic protease
MITGIVTTSIETTIRLKVRVSVTNGQEHEIEAVVDTGFNGFLTLPSALMTSLGLPTRGARQATVADGRTVRLDVDYENPSSLILHRLFDES